MYLFEVQTGHSIRTCLKLKIKYRKQDILKLIICYISSGGATNIAEVSSGFHQADWSNTLPLLLLSNQFFVLLYLFTFLLASRTQLDCAHMQTSGQFKCALYNK